jgi:hypothetical protein
MKLQKNEPSYLNIPEPITPRVLPPGQIESSAPLHQNLSSPSPNLSVPNGELDQSSNPISTIPSTSRNDDSFFKIPESLVSPNHTSKPLPRGLRPNREEEFQRRESIIIPFGRARQATLSDLSAGWVVNHELFPSFYIFFLAVSSLGFNVDEFVNMYGTKTENSKLDSF